jgi:hypothetical protein
LKLRSDESLSNLAFNFNLRHYSEEAQRQLADEQVRSSIAFGALEAGAYTRPLFSST